MNIAWERYRQGSRPKNPFKAWLFKQPGSITQSYVATQLGVGRAHVSMLMAEGTTRLPSPALGEKIEKLTDGEVTTKRMLNYAVRNRRKADDKVGA